MTTEELTVAFLVQAVLEKLRARERQALVVYTGSNIGFEPGLASLRRLREEGFSFQVLLSRSAATLLDVDAIREALRPEALWVDRPEETPEALTAKYDTILVPALTVNTAAHVAACMADAPAAAVILDGLMRGKNVIAALDGACPDNAERARRGFHMAEPLKERLREHLDTLRTYGAKLTTTDRLDEKTLRALGGWGPAPDQTAGAVYAMGTDGSDTYASKIRPEDATAHRAHGPGGRVTAPPMGRVLSGTYVKNWPMHTALAVPGGTLVTQLAKEEAARRDIRIFVDQT